MIVAYDLIEWAVAALLALGATLVALRALKLSPTWSVVIGMVVFAGLWFPIRTHAVKIDIPPPQSNHDATGK